MALATATIIALGGSVIGGGMNLAQAAKARSRQRSADTEAGRLMAEAKSKLEKDFYEGLSIPMEAYDQAQEANIQQQRQSIEALQQADSRSLAAGVGKVNMAASENTEKVRAAQAAEMFALDKMKAGNKDDMNQQLAAMDVAGAQDQEKRAAQADEQAGMMQQSAVNSITSGITSAAESQALYKKRGVPSLPVSKLERQVSKLDADPMLKRSINPNTGLNQSQGSVFGGSSDFVKNFSLPPVSTTGSNLLQGVGAGNMKTFPELKLDYGFSYSDRMNALKY